MNLLIILITIQLLSFKVCFIYCRMTSPVYKTQPYRKNKIVNVIKKNKAPYHLNLVQSLQLSALYFVYQFLYIQRNLINCWWTVLLMLFSLSSRHLYVILDNEPEPVIWSEHALFHQYWSRTFLLHIF